eukprot:GHVP01029595.1.p1 GENE.GHVP01029595.1~~GHVP01029595.1.p1  ORF type:complete len:475 (-),score=69.88 GHVP01029595.1:534-1958(-)
MECPFHLIPLFFSENENNLWNSDFLIEESEILSDKLFGSGRSLHRDSYRDYYSYHSYYSDPYLWDNINSYMDNRLLFTVCSIGIIGYCIIQNWEYLTTPAKSPSNYLPKTIQTIKSPQIWTPDTNADLRSPDDFTSVRLSDLDLLDPSTVCEEVRSEVCQKGDERLSIPLTIFNSTFVGLVDTGADSCLISQKFVKEAGLEWMVEPSQSVATGVGQTKVLGNLYCPVILGEHASEPVMVKLLVAETQDLLIGTDLMVKLKMHIDTKNSNVSFEFPSGKRRLVEATKMKNINEKVWVKTGNKPIRRSYAKDSWKELKDRYEKENSKYENIYYKLSKSDRALSRCRKPSGQVSNPELTIRVGDVSLQGTVDTGACHCTISRALLQKIQGLGQIKRDNFTIYGIGKMAAAGYWTAPVNINGAQFLLDFQIMDEEVGGNILLLGQTFLRPANAYIAFDHDKVQIRLEDGLTQRLVDLF